MVGKKHEESFSHMNRHLSDRWIGAAVTFVCCMFAGTSPQLIPSLCPFSVIWEWREVTLPKWRRLVPPTLGFKNALQKSQVTSRTLRPLFYTVYGLCF